MIKELSTELINLISAGEVVERPLSVVKELVENAIDADANQIKVDLISSGLKKITVSDNGKGIPSSELPTALKPHSTSKIISKEDLFSINTLGFRGEALPSISQVSMFKITSKTIDEDAASFIEVHGGKVINSGLCSYINGTKVEVENLFYNTPARLKHLTSEQNELSLIISLITRFSLANEYVSFTLTNDSKIIFKSTGDGFKGNLLNDCFGTTSATHMYEFNGIMNNYKISGYTSNNNVFRSNKNGISIFCNNRIIRNINLQYAITDAYESIIPIGKYPLCVLKIECDSEMVDVNIHPSKMEIKFTDEDNLRSFITSTIKKVLYEKPLIYTASQSDLSSNNNVLKEEYKLLNDEASLDDIWNTYKEANLSCKEDVLKINNDFEDLSIINNYLEEVNSFNSLNNSDNLYFDDTEIKEEQLFNSNEFSFDNLNYIGQFNETYLLFEDNNNLYLLDQHAAAERVNYERICEELDKDHHECYELLIPFNIEFNRSDCELINLYIEDILKQGIIMEPFGDTSFVVRQIPIWIPQGLEIEYISDIVNHIINNRKVNKRIMYESLARSLACKKSIKAYMRVTKEEVSSLIDLLKKCNMPYTCPHGRPVFVSITKYEIEKMFKRVI